MTYANCPECGFVAFHPTKTGYCGFVCERKAKDASIEKLTAQLAAAEKVLQEIADAENPEHYGNARDALHAIKLRAAEAVESLAKPASGTEQGHRGGEG